MCPNDIIIYTNIHIRNTQSSRIPLMKYHMNTAMKRSRAWRINAPRSDAPHLRHHPRIDSSASILNTQRGFSVTSTRPKPRDGPRLTCWSRPCTFSTATWLITNEWWRLISRLNRVLCLPVCCSCSRCSCPVIPLSTPVGQTYNFDKKNERKTVYSTKRRRCFKMKRVGLSFRPCVWKRCASNSSCASLSVWGWNKSAAETASFYWTTRDDRSHRVTRSRETSRSDATLICLQ